MVIVTEGARGVIDGGARGVMLIYGGARGVMLIVAGYGHGDTSSNPGRGWLHFA